MCLTTRPMKSFSSLPPLKQYYGLHWVAESTSTSTLSTRLSCGLQWKYSFHKKIKFTDYDSTQPLKIGKRTNQSFTALKTESKTQKSPPGVTSKGQLFLETAESPYSLPSAFLTLWNSLTNVDSLPVQQWSRRIDRRSYRKVTGILETSLGTFIFPLKPDHGRQ